MRKMRYGTVVFVTVSDLAIETFHVSMEPFLGLAGQAGSQVANLQVCAGRPQQIVHLEPPQDVGYKALEFFEV
jgi:hypothetical protein